MTSLKEKLRLVREYTGASFGPAKGYDLRAKLNFGQRMAVEKYYNKIMDLQSIGETVKYKPKRGEKTEAFIFSGQNGYRKFDTAIIRKFSPDQKFNFHIDKSRPKGSRFVAYDRITKRSYYNIPAILFLSLGIDIEDYNNTAISERAIEDILDVYADEAEFFLINAGSSVMWGQGGDRNSISKKIVQVFQNYSSSHFDPNNKNSSFYGNWFGGVTAFSSHLDVMPAIGNAVRKQREYREKYRMHPTKRYRRLRNRLIGVYDKGRLVETIDPTAWEID